MDSKSIVRKDVRVRIPLPARFLSKRSAGGKFGHAPILFRPMRIQKSLHELGDRLTRARDELRIVDEQLVYQNDVVDEAETRMLVSETPVADRAFRTARDDKKKLEAQRERALREIDDLRREQDRLLDRMLGAES
jgi:hypothetical protein